jgi:hypothetical protein
MSITVLELEAKIREMRKKHAAYDAVKKQAEALYAEYVQLEEAIMQDLERLGKKSYKVEGLGTISVAEKLTVTTPKTVEDKMGLMDYILNKYGRDVMLSKFSVNYQTLQAFYTEEYELSEHKATFKLPGIGEPKAVKTARWLTERPKKV